MAKVKVEFDISSEKKKGVFVQQWIVNYVRDWLKGAGIKNIEISIE